MQTRVTWIRWQTGREIHAVTMPMALELLRDGTLDFVTAHVLPNISEEFEITHQYSAPLVCALEKGTPRRAFAN